RDAGLRGRRRPAGGAAADRGRVGRQLRPLRRRRRAVRRGDPGRGPLHPPRQPVPRLREPQMTLRERINLDGVLIVGAGLAGLPGALAAAPRRALVLAAAALGDGCSSAWAQGGMAAALSSDDAPELHAADTIAAGAGLCDPAAVAVLTREGP